MNKNSSRFLVSLSCLVVGCQSFCASSYPAIAAESWQDKRQKAYDYIKDKNWDKALELYAETCNTLIRLGYGSSPELINSMRRYSEILEQKKFLTESSAIKKANKLIKPKINYKAIQKNNEGVIALNSRDYEKAIEHLEGSLRAYPNYATARKNLAIAYNNHGLALQKQPHLALKKFRKGLFLDPTNKTTRMNVLGLYKAINKNGNDFDFRVKNGDALLKHGDNLGAYLEYSEAFRLKNDSKVLAKMKSVPKLDPAYEGVRLAVHEKKKKADKFYKKAEGSDPKEKAEEPGVNFGPYMASLQRKLKAAWRPPVGNRTKRIQVVFKVHRDGRISNRRITKSSGTPVADQAALDAVNRVKKFDPLPTGAPANVDILFTFDYNVFRSNRHRTIYRSKNRKKKIASVSAPRILLKNIVDLENYLESNNEKEYADQLIAKSDSKVDSTAKLKELQKASSIAKSEESISLIDKKVESLSKKVDIEKLVAELIDKKEYGIASFLLKKTIGTIEDGTKKAELERKLHSATAFSVADNLKNWYHEYSQNDDIEGLIGLSKSDKEYMITKKFILNNEPAQSKKIPPLPESLDVSIKKDATSLSKQPQESQSNDDFTDIKYDETIDFKSEIDKLVKAVEQNSNKRKLSILLTQYGHQLEKEKKYSKALTRYRQAIYICNDNDAATAKLNQCYKTLGEEPKDVTKRLFKLISFRRAGKLSQAIAEGVAIEKYFDISKPETRSFQSLVALYMMLDNQTETGLKKLSAGLESPWSGSYKGQLSNTHLGLGNWYQANAFKFKKDGDKSKTSASLANASREYIRAIIIDPENKRAAKKLIETAKLASLYVQSANNLVVLGSAYFLCGDKARAIHSYQSALTKESGNKLVKKALDFYMKSKKAQ